MEEAQSKLSDPDIKIYAYHGGNRKRDVAFLAQQDIVVTTYSILGSDAVYWYVTCRCACACVRMCVCVRGVSF